VSSERLWVRGLHGLTDLQHTVCQLHRIVMLVEVLDCVEMELNGRFATQRAQLT